jgi:hypothetical protein
MVYKVICIVLLSAALSGCSVGSDGGGGGGGSDKPQKASYVNWDSIPAEFNPSIDEIGFQTHGVNKIDIDAFSFDKDVEVIYSSMLAPGAGLVKIFKVWKNQARWGNLRPRTSGTKLDLHSYGTYQCSIRVKDGNIVDLDGGCYVKLQVFMPVGSEIEVYNVGKLVSKRFIPMENESFLESLDDATWAADKFAVIEDFLASYTGARRPVLSTYELGKVIEEFMQGQEKLRALSRLHTIVSDRQNLAAMIEEEFSYFDREEARKIVGLR